MGRIKKKWSFNAYSEISSSPVSGKLKKGGDNVIVFGTKDGKVYMLEKNARVKWKYNIPLHVSELQRMFLDEETVRGIYSTATISDIDMDGKSEILIGCDTGELYVIESSGNVLWKFESKGSIRSSALVADINNDGLPEILIGSADNYLYALNNKGRVLWKFRAESGIESTPNILQGKQPKIVFGSNDGTVYCITTRGGLLWSFKTEDKITAQPAVGYIDINIKKFKGSKYGLVVGSFDHYLYAINEEGILFWKFKTEGKICSRAVIVDINSDRKSEIIFTSCDNRVYALNSFGKKLWSYETNFWIVSSPIVTDVNNDGRLEIVVGSYDHSLYIFSVKGEFLSKLSEYKADSMIIGSTYIPIKGDGKEIVIGTKKGRIDKLVYEK